MEERLTGGTIGTIAFGVVVVFVALVSLGALWFVSRNEDTADKWAGRIIGGGVIVVVVAIIGAFVGWGMWPWKSEYHHWVPTTGTVESAQARMIGDGNGGTSQYFAVKYTDGRIRRCDDTRCGVLEKGDHLTLLCVRQWQWSGEHGYNCNYGRTD